MNNVDQPDFDEKYDEGANYDPCLESHEDVEQKCRTLSLHETGTQTFVNQVSGIAAVPPNLLDPGGVDKFMVIKDGDFHDDVYGFLQERLLAEFFEGITLRVSFDKIEVIILSQESKAILGERGARIRELARLLQVRYDLPGEKLALFVHRT